MRCLIPVTQEIKNENALKRARLICSETHVLYVLEGSVLERMESESSYILNSDMLNILKESIMESQREEAADIAKKAGASLHFEIGDYFDVIRRYSERLRPAAIMTDEPDRKMLSLERNIWVDRGNEIKSSVFLVGKAIRIGKLLKDLNLAKEISGKLKASFGIYYEGKEREIMATLEKHGKIAEGADVDLVFIRGDMPGAPNPKRYAGRSMMIFRK